MNGVTDESASKGLRKERFELKTKVKIYLLNLPCNPQWIQQRKRICVSFSLFFFFVFFSFLRLIMKYYEYYMELFFIILKNKPFWWEESLPACFKVATQRFNMFLVDGLSKYLCYLDEFLIRINFEN